MSSDPGGLIPVPFPILGHWIESRLYIQPVTDARPWTKRPMFHVKPVRSLLRQLLAD